MRFPVIWEYATAQEVNALAAVTGSLSLRRAFEVGRGGRDAAAEVVVDHGVVADRDVTDGAGSHPAARTPSPRALLTVKPLNRTWELRMTTPAKMVSVPSPGMLTVSVGLTPVSSMVACRPTSDSGLDVTTCSW